MDAPLDGAVSTLHLARELVRAEAMATRTQAVCLLDRHESWTAYRDMVLGWRYALLRGKRPRYLQLCPSCGHVLRAPPGELRCLMCDCTWTGANP